MGDYITVQDVINFCGFGVESFKTNGVVMTTPQFELFCNNAIDHIEQMLHKYCNVKSYALHTVVEYHDGRDESDTDSSYDIYTEEDLEYALYQKPLSSVTTVEVDSADLTSVPAWSTMTERSASAAGDYTVITTNEYSVVRFHNNFPKARSQNVRITYVAGYSPSSAEYGDLKTAALRMMTNFLMLKRKVQESITIRDANVRDYSQIFDIYNESEILTDTIASQLERYRVRTVPTLYGYS